MQASQRNKMKIVHSPLDRACHVGRSHSPSQTQTARGRQDTQRSALRHERRHATTVGATRSRPRSNDKYYIFCGSPGFSDVAKLSDSVDSKSKAGSLSVDKDTDEKVRGAEKGSSGNPESRSVRPRTSEYPPWHASTCITNKSRL